MVKKGNPNQNDDGLTELMLDEEGPIWRIPIPQKELENQPRAESKWSTGRACPRCASSLKFFEYNEEKDIVYVQCSQCAQVYAQPDLEAHQFHIEEGVVDNINYRNIPDDLVRMWMRAREQEKMRNGEWE